MCRLIFITDGPVCECQGDLRAALGEIIYVPEAPPGTKDDDKQCLCWVDVPAMSARAGYTVEDNGDWTLTKSSG